MLAEFENVLGNLKVAWRNGDKAMCFCPAHDDRKEGESQRQGLRTARLLLHCFVGCPPGGRHRHEGKGLQQWSDLFDGRGRGILYLLEHACTLARSRDENPHANGHNKRASGDARSEHGCTLEDYSEREEAA